jgi:hypothetical protein
MASVFGEFAMRSRFEVQSILVAVVVASLVACGGDGDGGSASVGNGLPPSTGPGDVENFFPDAPGDSSNYFVTEVDTPPGSSFRYFDSFVITGTKVIDGQTASITLESNQLGLNLPREEYYLKNAGGVAFLGSSDATDPISTAVLPYITALFPVTPGIVAQFDKNGIDYGSDVDGDGVHETVNLSYKGTVDGFEPLTVAIGPFARTVKSTNSVTGSVVLSRTQTPVPFSSIATHWSAPGVGLVKSTQSTSIESTKIDTTMSKRGYVVNGVAHGLSLPHSITSVPHISGPPALATDGEHNLAISPSASGVTGVLFDFQGNSSAGFEIGSATSPGAAFDGANFWMVYLRQNGASFFCLAQRVTPTGTLLDTLPINVSPDPSVGSVAQDLGMTQLGLGFSKTNGLIVYSVSVMSSGQVELYGVLVNPDGAVVGGGAFPITSNNHGHANPVVGFDGTNYFVVWADRPANVSMPQDNAIYGVRISTTGVVLDSAPIAISTRPGSSNPGVASDGSNFLIVWQSGSDVRGARVSSAGVLLDGPADAGGLPISDKNPGNAALPVVAFTGSEYLVAWQTLAFDLGAIRAVRVSTAGGLPGGTGNSIAVSEPVSSPLSVADMYPAVAGGLQRTALAWVRNPMNAQSTGTLASVTVSPF